MSVRVRANSRLFFADLVMVNGIEFFDITNLPAFETHSGDIAYTVLDGDRIDLLAFRFYGDSIFWWVIAWANGFDILPTDLQMNASIIIPDPVFVKTQLLPKAAAGKTTKAA